jgi:hypothetical protein
MAHELLREGAPAGGVRLSGQRRAIAVGEVGNADPDRGRLAGTERLGVGRAQREAGAGPGGIGADDSAGGVECAVEEHRLDADVVVEPLQVPQIWSGRGDVGV